MQKPGGIIALLDEAWYDFVDPKELFLMEFREDQFEKLFMYLLVQTDISLKHSSINFVVTKY
jgi:hypothetical protein